MAELRPGAFFLVVPIGLETAAEKELNEWSSVFATEFGSRAFLRNVEVVKGGIEFEIDPGVGLLFNRCLKIPSRLLQRVRVWQTRDWQELEKQLRQVPWRDFFPEGISDWEISASASKMNNEKHLLKLLEEKFAGRSYQVSPEKGITAYLRVHDNVFTLSRDTSGEHLHFRGYRGVQGEAPLRENLAAFLWSFLMEGRSRLDAQRAKIIDPFVGSGTLLLEAQLWNRPVTTRKFTADRWISKTDERHFANVCARLQPWSLQLVGYDRDPLVLEKARQNAEQLGAEDQIQFFCGDSTTGASEHPGESVWLMSNPPYGGKGRLRSELSWSELWHSALKKFNPDWAVVLGPEREGSKGIVFSDWQCVESRRFLNGGLRVAATLWKKKTAR